MNPLAKFEAAASLKRRIDALNLVKARISILIKNSEFALSQRVLLNGSISESIISFEDMLSSDRIIYMDQSDMDFMISSIDKRIEELKSEFNKLLS